MRFPCCFCDGDNKDNIWRLYMTKSYYQNEKVHSSSVSKAYIMIDMPTSGLRQQYSLMLKNNIGQYTKSPKQI